MKLLRRNRVRPDFSAYCASVLICLCVSSKAAICMETYSKGFEVLGAGKSSNYQLALNLADRALTGNPNDPWALFLKAEYFRYSGKFAQALKFDDLAIHCGEVARLSSVHLSKFHEYRGHTLFALKRFGEAEKEARLAIELDSSTAGHFMLVADSLRAQMRYKEAISFYDSVDKRIKGYMPALEGKSDCLQHLGRTEDRNYMNGILAKEPKNQSAHYAKFLNHLASGFPLDAERDLDKLVAIAPAWESHYPEVIRAYMKRHEIQRATALCDKLNRFEKHGIGFDLLAEIQWNSGNREAAIKSCSRALAREPKNGAFRLHRAGMLRKLEKFADAVNDYTYLIGEFKAPYERERALCYLSMSQFEKAVSDFSVVVKRLHSWQDYKDRAKCYLALKQCGKALSDIDEALVLATVSKAYEVRRIKFDILCAMGKHAEALAEADRLVDLQKFNPEILRLRAGVFEKLGRKSEAKRDIARAEQLEKENTSTDL